MATGKTIFKRIIDKDIPAQILYEDDLTLAFRDVNPQAPTHILVIPKQELRSTNDLTESEEVLAGRLLLTAKKVAADQGLNGGYRIVINCGPDAGQTVDHLHLHVIGGRSLGWPPG